MTPSEKAEELIDKFVVKCIHRTQAKNCAIICAEQIIEWEIGTHCDETSATEYW